MRRIKLTIEYDGSGFVGWQRQLNGLSVQESIERALQQLIREEITIYGAGRTDAGVHALAQVAHFDTLKHYPPETIKRALNFYLKPAPISILEAEEVDADFHARFSARERSYIYQIINRSAPLALLRTKAWHVAKPLDIEKMRQASEHLLGKHDFSSFRSSYCQSPSAIKSLTEITFLRNDDLIKIHLKAPSFLHNQVRIIVGTLAKVGCGERSPETVEKILLAKDRKAAGPTAPAHGLFFEKILYE